jgi:predicted aspartyl protease
VIFTFPYQEQYGVDPSPAAPGHPVFRPKIPVKISGPRADHHVAIALVDTGADETILPLSVARPLRVQLDSQVHYLRDAGNNPIPVRYGVIRLTIAQIGIGDYTWEAKVGFQKYRRYSVLGHAGCLERLDVRFDGPNRRVVITTPNS